MGQYKTVPPRSHGPNRARPLSCLKQERGTLLSEQIKSSGGYEPLLPLRTSRIRDALDIGPFFGPVQARAWANHRGLVERMGLQCIVTSKPQPLLAEAGFELVPKSRAPGLVYRSVGALPRARLVFDVRSVASDVEAFELMMSETIDPRATVIIEASDELKGLRDTAPSRSRLPPCPDASAARVETIEYSAEQVRIRTKSACAGYLVLAHPMRPAGLPRLMGAQHRFTRQTICFVQ